jgi:hypothetical protein
MRRNSGWLDLAHLRYMHEVLFSLSTAFLGVSLLFLAVPSLRVPFTHLEVRINLLLHIRQTDLIRGYFEYLIPSAIVALCVATILQMTSGTQLTKEFLRSVSGFMLLLAAPIYWFCLYQVIGWPFGWPYRWAPAELAVAVSLATLYLVGRRPFPMWIGIFFLAGHYFFWYWIPGSNPGLADYSGPIAPILGFCSASVWVTYVGRLRRIHDSAMPNV